MANISGHRGGHLGPGSETSAEWRRLAQGYIAHLLDKTDWKPRWTATFSGALRYTRYGAVTRWIMKMISRHTGGPTDTSRDHEFTDWDAVDRFAERLTAELGSGRGAIVRAF
jgi:menaquinone-dependent protoporphyrinogen oxidase